MNFADFPVLCKEIKCSTTKKLPIVKKNYFLTAMSAKPAKKAKVPEQRLADSPTGGTDKLRPAPIDNKGKQQVSLNTDETGASTAAPKGDKRKGAATKIVKQQSGAGAKQSDKQHETPVIKGGARTAIIKTTKIKSPKLPNWMCSSSPATSPRGMSSGRQERSSRMSSGRGLP